MKKRFKVHAAMAEEQDGNWIWIDTTIPTRTIVKVENPRAKRSIYCQVRQLDANYIARYNAPTETGPKRYPIDKKHHDDVLVISQWYRDALGGFPTTRDRGDTCIELVISDQPRVFGLRVPALWMSLRASNQHPDIIARIGTRLGVLGAWLGLIALVPAVTTLLGHEKDIAAGASMFGTAVVAGAIAIFACRGAKAATPALGILAYGSLLNDQGDSIQSHVTARRPVQTEWPVEYARDSSGRGGAPTLVRHRAGGLVRGAILMLDMWDWDIERVRKWLREREGKPDPSAIKSQKISDRLTVLYADLDATIPDDQLNAEHLADLAIASVPRACERNGIRYLADNIKAGVFTPLTLAYRDAILKKTGAANLAEAERIVRERSLPHPTP